MSAADCFVSVIAPLRNDSTVIDSFIKEIITVLKKNYTNYELVLVDDGSEDDTVKNVTSLLGQYECIRLIRLSRKFGTEIAIASGLDSVIGDFVVVMLPDSDPPELIPEMVRQARSGQDVVFGIRRDRAGETLWMRGGARLFYWGTKKFFGIDLPKDATHFRVLSRQVVNAVTQIKDKNRYLRLLSASVGYANQSFLYQPIQRHEKPRPKGFLESINMAIGIIVTHSIHPLRFVSTIGLLASVLNFLYVGYIIIVYLFKEQVAEGWTTLSLQTAGMFFFVFLILTVLSEYVGRILDESKERPLYYILEERNSSVLLADQDRRNVVNDSSQVGPRIEEAPRGEK
jgi:dolichol-phosphate mannosyltransferase